MTKTLFIVLGPESSGTRVVTEILEKQKGFIDMNSRKHESRFDEIVDYIGKDNQTAIEKFNNLREGYYIMRRSLPHLKQFLDFIALKDFVFGVRGQVVFIFTTRDKSIMVESQMKNHGWTREESIMNIDKAYNFIYELTCGTNHIFVSYETLIGMGVRYLERLLISSSHKIPLSVSGEFLVDGNKKYMESENGS